LSLLDLHLGRRFGGNNWTISHRDSFGIQTAGLASANGGTLRRYGFMIPAIPGTATYTVFLSDFVAAVSVRRAREVRE
jgi:hypothetical protein